MSFRPTGIRGLQSVVGDLVGAQAALGRQVAVFIAVDRYQHWMALKNPVKDARELRDIITKRYYVDEIVELYDEQATRGAIARLFGRFIETTEHEDSGPVPKERDEHSGASRLLRHAGADAKQALRPCMRKEGRAS